MCIMIHWKAIQVVATSTATAEGLIIFARQEEVTTTVEPGTVADVDLASVIYSIPEEGEIETPTLEHDRQCRMSDSVVSIDPYVAEWKDYSITDASFSIPYS